MSTILLESCPIWCIKISKTDSIRHQKVKDFIIFFNAKPPPVVRVIRQRRISHFEPAWPEAVSHVRILPYPERPVYGCVSACFKTEVNADKRKNPAQLHMQARIFPLISSIRMGKNEF